MLEESPSLRREVAGLIVKQTSRVRALVRANFEDHGEQPRIDINSVTYTEAQVLGDWLPENE